MSPTDLLTMIGSLVLTAVSVSWYLGTQIKAPLDLMAHKLEVITKEHVEIWEELKHARIERAEIWKDRAKLSERLITMEATKGNQ
jgi:hypothetical protein